MFGSFNFSYHIPLLVTVNVKENNYIMYMYEHFVAHNTRIRAIRLYEHEVIQPHFTHF